MACKEIDNNLGRLIRKRSNAISSFFLTSTSQPLETRTNRTVCNTKTKETRCSMCRASTGSNKILAVWPNSVMQGNRV